MTEQLEKLAAARIQLVRTDISSHYIVKRAGFVAFLERPDAGFGNVNAPGLATERGFAALVWRGEQAFLLERPSSSPPRPSRSRRCELLRKSYSSLSRVRL